ncbi:MAG TPA: hypothetical protein VK445_07490 [Dissulfurispiraceae bacterium]|nr:hypothetical protein [Dissulfurispiraceae bacterium]
MKKKCEICGAEKTPENKLFVLRIADTDDMGAEVMRSRAFCEVCLGYGADMYESFMKTKMAPRPEKGGCGSKKNS